jgi:hypothetical protein
VDAGRDAADTGGDVVAGEGALAALVESAMCIQREGHGGDGDASLESGVDGEGKGHRVDLSVSSVAPTGLVF